MGSYTITFNTDGLGMPEIYRIITQVANDVANRGDVRPLIRIKDADGKRRGFATADHALVNAGDDLLRTIEQAREVKADADHPDAERDALTQLADAAQHFVTTLYG